jgi:hypothetical protein
MTVVEDTTRLTCLGWKRDDCLRSNPIHNKACLAHRINMILQQQQQQQRQVG